MRLRTTAVSFVLFAGIGISAIAGQQGPIIAVFDIQDKGSGIDEQTKDNLVDLLSARLAKAGYRVIPRDQVRKRLFEAKKESFKECYDQSCQIELGRELAAQKTLAIKILKIGATCQITAELYDLRQSTTDLATTAEAKCQDDQSVLQAFTKVAEDLNRPLLGSQRRLDEGLDEMTRLAGSEDGSKEERAGRAWLVAQEITQDTMIAKEGKIKAIRKYLDDFKDAVSETAAKAKTLLVEIDLATLVVMSSPPGAKVLLDDEQAGIAPYSRKLKAGEYRVKGRLDGHEQFEEKVQLQPGEKRELSMMLKKIKSGTLVVNASPGGAWVDIDGKTVGQVPVAKDLEPGEHEVKVKLSGYVMEKRKVSVKSDEQASLGIELKTIPTRPEILWGHVTFWSGVGFTALGGVGLGSALKLRDDYNAGDRSAKNKIVTWTGVMYAGFMAGAALMVTGAVLWNLAPDKASWVKENKGYLGVTTTGHDLVFSAGGRW